MTGEQDSAPDVPADETAERPAVSPADADRAAAEMQAQDPFAERPEAFVAGAFAGGLLVALILRRLRR